jgi:hypothetical protein
MQTVTQRRKYLTQLVKKEAQNDRELRSLIPQTDDQGNHVIQKENKKPIVQSDAPKSNIPKSNIPKSSIQQNIKNGKHIRDLERQTNITHTIEEKQKEFNAGLTVIPIEQQRSTVQRISDSIAMQDQARKNAKRLTNDDNEVQDVMSNLIPRGEAIITLFNKVYPELYKFFENRSLITAQEIIRQFDKIERRVNLQNTSDDFVFTRDTMDNLIGDIMTRIGGMPANADLVTALNDIEAAVHNVDRGNVQSQAELTNITNGLAQLSTDIQTMDPTQVVAAVTALSAQLQSQHQDLPTQGNMRALFDELLLKLDNVPPTPELLNALHEIQTAVESGNVSANVATTLATLTTAPTAAPGVAPSSAESQQLINSVVNLSNQLLHLQSTQLNKHDMTTLVDSILVKLDHVPASPELLNALSDIDVAISNMDTTMSNANAASQTAITNALAQLSSDVQTMDPQQLTNAVLALGTKLDGIQTTQLTQGDMQSLTDSIIAKLDNVPASPELLTALQSIDTTISLMDGSNTSSQTAITNALTQLSSDIQTMNPQQLTNAVIELGTKIDGLQTGQLTQGDMQTLVDTIIAKLDNIQPTQELMDALARIEQSIKEGWDTAKLEPLLGKITMLSPKQLEKETISTAKKLKRSPEFTKSEKFKDDREAKFRQERIDNLLEEEAKRFEKYRKYLDESMKGITEDVEKYKEKITQLQGDPKDETVEEFQNDPDSIEILKEYADIARQKGVLTEYARMIQGSDDNPYYIFERLDSLYTDVKDILLDAQLFKDYVEHYNTEKTPKLKPFFLDMTGGDDMYVSYDVFRRTLTGRKPKGNFTYATAMKEFEELMVPKMSALREIFEDRKPSGDDRGGDEGDDEGVSEI